MRSEISVPLSTLVNLLFNTGVFPSSVELARAMLIFKKGDQQDYHNYRPISVLPNISKFTEKCLHIQISGLRQSPYNDQFGFRNNHFSNHALIRITEKI